MQKPIRRLKIDCHAGYDQKWIGKRSVWNTNEQIAIEIAYDKKCSHRKGVRLVDTISELIQMVAGKALARNAVTKMTSR